MFWLYPSYATARHRDLRLGECILTVSSRPHATQPLKAKLIYLGKTLWQCNDASGLITMELPESRRLGILLPGVSFELFGWRGIRLKRIEMLPHDPEPFLVSNSYIAFGCDSYNWRVLDSTTSQWIADTRKYYVINIKSGAMRSLPNIATDGVPVFLQGTAMICLRPISWAEPSSNRPRKFVLEYRDLDTNRCRFHTFQSPRFSGPSIFRALMKWGPVDSGFRSRLRGRAIQLRTGLGQNVRVPIPKEWVKDISRLSQTKVSVRAVSGDKSIRPASSSASATTWFPLRSDHQHLKESPPLDAPHGLPAYIGPNKAGHSWIFLGVGDESEASSALRRKNISFVELPWLLWPSKLLDKVGEPSMSPRLAGIAVDARDYERAKRLVADKSVALEVARPEDQLKVFPPPEDKDFISDFRQSRAPIFSLVDTMVRTRGMINASRQSMEGASPPLTAALARVKACKYAWKTSSGDIFLSDWTFGADVTCEYEKGIAYLRRPPKQALPSLDRCTFDPTQKFVGFRRISGHYFVFLRYSP